MLSSMSGVLSSIRDNAYLAVRGLAAATTPVVVVAVVCFSGTLLFSASLFASELSAEIGAGALNSGSGFIATNVTTGDSNIQQNSGVFSVGIDESTASISAAQDSEVILPPESIEQTLSVQIEAGAFNDTLGIIMVNQSAGIGNTQLNGAAIAVGNLTMALIELRDDALEETVTAPDPDSLPLEDFSLTQTQTSLSPDAFTKASGAVQINQVAGNLNATSNRFVMSVHQ